MFSKPDELLTEMRLLAPILPCPGDGAWRTRETTMTSRESERAGALLRRTCRLCGRPNTARRFSQGGQPRTGKAMVRHKCAHGEWCVAGDRVLGMHANHAKCEKCREEVR